MTYIILLAAALLFIFGWADTKHLIKHFSDREERRNFLLRLSGFFVMSWWIHVIPSMLLIIHMRKEGVIASEIIDDDNSRATITSIFMAPEVAFMILAASWGGIWSAIEKKSIKQELLPLIGGVVIYIWVLIYYIMQRNYEYAIYLFLISAPIVLYAYMALLSPLEQQIRLYWVPFALIGAITGTMFLFGDTTHKLVAVQLSSFGAGGATSATATPYDNSQTYHGRLILMTRETTYLEISNPHNKAKCVIRISNSAAAVATKSEQPEEEPQNNAARTICGPLS